MKNTLLLSLILLSSISSYCQKSKTKGHTDNNKFRQLKDEIKKVSHPNNKTVQIINYNQYVAKNSDSSYREPIPNALKNVYDRLYVSNIGIETYRQNLDEVLGRLIYYDNGKYNIGLFTVKNDTTKVASFVPENGRLISHKLTKNSSKSISLFINASATDDRIYEYYVTDISRAVLKNKDLNIKRLTNLTNEMSKESLKYFYVITGVTVTEIYKREFKKKTKKIRADKFPISGTAISFGGSFFVSNENFERQYKVGLTVSRLDIVKTEINNLFKND
ncbi:hypothetical protein RQM59_08620 [Flavobacteriaceae bacterium S356]|uniref:Uncharacterized protein n=1 Tax=Asprobacillus argus TaxID=3076534 RepID=A0ABU3LGL7_9FLAO|nr:hypothetical protein [Flavobacteriaceae bacterium S356]